MKQIIQVFLEIEIPTLRAIIWLKNEKDWTKALSSFLIKVIECVIE